MFRSEDMSLKRLVFAKESTWETFNFLAGTEKVMFAPSQNVKTSSLSAFASKKIKRFEETFEILAKIEEKIDFFQLHLKPLRRPAKVYLSRLDRALKERKLEGSKYSDSLEEELRKKSSLLDNHLQNYDQLLKNRTDYTEKMLALNELMPGGKAAEALGLKEKGLKRLTWIIGLVPTAHLFTIQKLIFRISRENAMLKSTGLPEIIDPLIPGHLKQEKTLIWLLLPGSDQDHLGHQVLNVLSNFGFVSLDTDVQIKDLKDQLLENEQIVSYTRLEIMKQLNEFVSPGILQDIPNIRELKLILQREASFTEQLMNLEEKDEFYSIQIWIPSSFSEDLRSEIDLLGNTVSNFTRPKLLDVSPAEKASDLVPPSRFTLPSFALAFQTVVDTYGVPRYKEMNPGIFTIATFPFMFGLMFGDIGHGAILLGIGIYLTFFFHDKMSLIFETRYLILLMGLFAFYCGFIYNEFFSVPLVSSSTCYNLLPDKKTFVKEEGCVYPFGLDYIWFQSTTETLFVNSFKMKFAIIIGVVQMICGIVLKCSNAVYFNSKINLFFEAVPQLVFMLVTFGYMVFCIIVKWLIDWTGKAPPSIISLFINFFEVKEGLWTDPATQQALQRIFIVVAFLCVILMFFPKPIFVFLQQKPKKNNQIPVGEPKLHDGDSVSDLLDDDLIHEDHNEPFGELLVHQMIETVEFVLGSISNTASYLRLWALSLAHGQLSKVFLTMIFSNAIADNESLIILIFRVIFGFLFWALVTFAIIMGMDSLECFLHALRLHWVEFQNKFFKGDGIAFDSFKFQFD